MNKKKLIVGITGASGAILAKRFLMHAAPLCEQIYLSMSKQAYQVIYTELDVHLDPHQFSVQEFLGQNFDNITFLEPNNFFSPPASGSFNHDGMVILPCSMGTLGRIANGISNDLITRSADVCLKEGRKLILVPREMPLNLIMLRNMTQLTEAGATILPASPAWYHRPSTIEDLADSIVARILQNLGIEQNIFGQWMIDEKCKEGVQKIY